MCVWDTTQRAGKARLRHRIKGAEAVQERGHNVWPVLVIVTLTVQLDDVTAVKHHGVRVAATHNRGKGGHAFIVPSSNTYHSRDRRDSRGLHELVQVRVQLRLKLR